MNMFQVWKTISTVSHIIAPPIVDVQYVYYKDGVTFARKGVRDTTFVVDVASTTLGFDGIEGVDWKNVKTVE